MDGPLECPAVEVDRGMLRLPRRPRDSHKGDYGRLFLLAGLLGGLTAQGRYGLPPWGAVWLHGRAGDLAAADRGEYGMTPSDLIGQIPYAIKELVNNEEESESCAG